MADYSQSFSSRYTTEYKSSRRFSRLYDFTTYNHVQIEQQITYQLLHNPALEIADDLDIFEEIEPNEGDDDWNPDYDKPLEEYETGDPPISQETTTWDALDLSANLEQSAIQRVKEHPELLEKVLRCVDHYRIHGCLPDDCDPILKKDLAVLEKSAPYSTSNLVYPTFEVLVEGDRVEANILPIDSNLRFVQGLGKYSTAAEKFINDLHERNRILNIFAHFILEILQADFFRQKDSFIGMEYLIPVPIEKLSKLCKSSPFKIDKKYLSKLGDHIVSCPFGNFPLNFFLPKKAQLVRLWVDLAEKNDMITKKQQLDWILDQLQERIKKWDTSDDRLEFIALFEKITIDDIKNARKKTRS